MTFLELEDLYRQPLFDLITQSRAVHLQHWRGEEVQRCSLLSLKTGGCSEDCAYCAQSAHYSTGLEREDLLIIPAGAVATCWAQPGAVYAMGPKNLSASWRLSGK